MKPRQEQMFDWLRWAVLLAAVSVLAWAAITLNNDADRTHAPSEPATTTTATRGVDAPAQAGSLGTATTTSAPREVGVIQYIDGECLYLIEPAAAPYKPAG